VEIENEPVSGDNPDPELLLSLDRSTTTPLHSQLELELRDQVRRGRLTPGARVPSSRALAAKLGVSRGVVLEAYSQLVAEGYLTASQGAPTRVSTMASAELPPLAASSLSRRRPYEFDPGLPDLSAFPRRAWLRSVRAALRDAPFDAFAPVDPRGSHELRNALMSYLGRVRGAAAEPEHTLICAGFTHVFATLCRVLRDRGVRRIAVEDPGWLKHRLIAERAGLEPIGIPVDEMGISIEGLAASACETVVVTPAHQFPIGHVLSSARRTALLEWAEDEDALIVEDDFDGELRYDREPVGALQGLAPERVAYVGSVSKRLAPALALGWVLSPSWLTGALTYERALADAGPPALEQYALADFIAEGELDRHLRRMRLVYRGRRSALAAAVKRHLPDASLVGAAAGLFALALLPEGVRAEAVVRAAAARGVGVEPAQASGQPGLVLGYGNLSEQAIEQGIGRLAEALAEVLADARRASA
jgi:GntR family transcriptional regulator/MocR family aminotransferase